MWFEGTSFIGDTLEGQVDKTCLRGHRDLEGGVHSTQRTPSINYLFSPSTEHSMKTCKFVTGNPNKVIEVNAILKDAIPIEPLALDIPEIQGTLEDIARDKCRRASKIVRSLL